MYKILGADQKEYGPVSAEQVREWILQGRANAQTRVQPLGAPDWKLLSECAEFADALSQAAPPRPIGRLSSAAISPTGAVTSPPTSGLAVTSLVLGIVGVFTCGISALVGVIMGIVALMKIDRSRGRLGGRGQALAGIIISGVSLLMIPLLVGALLPAFARAREKALTVRCLSNVRQLSLGLVVYADGHNGQLPAANQWCEAVATSLGGNTNLFVCVRGSTGQQTHYALNARLAGVDLKSLTSPSTTVLVFEGQGGWDLSGGKELLPSAPRHKGGYVVGFVDGHAEVVRAQSLGRLRWDP